MLDISSHDVLLIGGGGAGLRAAIAVAETNPNLSVAVISKVYPMRSHTVSAEGGAAGVIGKNDSLDEHCYDTISGGDWLPDQDAVEAFVKEAPLELMRLEHWGCPWNREPDGHIAVRPFGGMKKERTWFAADKTGFHMLHTLFQTSLKYDAVARYDEYYATKLLMDDGQVQGAVAVIGCAPVEREGFYYQPSILDRVTAKSRAYHEELFGPVAIVIRASDEADALRIANESRFGLGSAIWSKDTARAEQLASQLQAGSTFINGLVKSDPRLPFGGVKASGYGRELSRLGIHEFVNAKTVWIR